MKPMTGGELAARIAGTTGAGGMGVLAGAQIRITAVQAVPAAMWVVAMAALIAVPAAVAALGLVLDYWQMKLEMGSVAELEKARQDMYRTVLEKTAAKPARCRELIIADALHLAVERNGAQPSGQTYGHRYGRGGRKVGPTGGSVPYRPRPDVGWMPPGRNRSPR